MHVSQQWRDCSYAYSCRRPELSNGRVCRVRHEVIFKYVAERRQAADSTPSNVTNGYETFQCLKDNGRVLRDEPTGVGLAYWWSRYYCLVSPHHSARSTFTVRMPVLLTRDLSLEELTERQRGSEWLGACQIC